MIVLFLKKMVADYEYHDFLIDKTVRPCVQILFLSSVF